MIDFRLLGPLQVSGNGEHRQVAGIKPKALLAVLLINRGRVVSSASIAAAIWNDNVPSAYPASLQVFMSTLRRSLRDLTAGGDGLVTTQSPGYRLSVDPLCVDVGRFERARGVADEQFAAGRYTDAAAQYRAALAEWSGPALADLRGHRFADDFAAAIEEERLATLQARIEADLACGRYAAVVGELTTLTTQHSLREPFWAQLMTAYYRMGRQADALEAGRRIRAVLNVELGIDPSPAIQDLERKILRQESLSAPQAAPPSIGMLQTMTETSGRLSGARLILASGQAVPIPARGLRIGRMPDNDLPIEDLKASRYHAVIVLTEKGFAISDLRSTNGTLVGARRVLDSRLLDDGDVIRIGATEFVFDAAG